MIEIRSNGMGLLFFLLFLPIAVLFVRLIYILVNNVKIRKDIASGKFISYEEFEKNWIVAKSGRKGYAGFKYIDRPGCYVITIYDDEVEDEEYSDYDDIYIGQSVNIFKRVHNHFNGKGNGDVYADIKNGRYVYVRFVPCDEEDMNVMEKRLIRAFNATNSYNATRGGGKRR